VITVAVTVITVTVVGGLHGWFALTAGGVEPIHFLLCMRLSPPYVREGVFMNMSEPAMMGFRLVEEVCQLHSQRSGGSMGGGWQGGGKCGSG
jgi:hypothetical protein